MDREMTYKLAEAIALKPCPFCGVEPDWKRWEINDIWQIKIFCDGPDCHVHPSIFGNEETMTKIWNTRAQPKYEGVDLDTLKMIKSDEFGTGYNAAIYHIKSKYGELYAEVK